MGWLLRYRQLIVYRTIAELKHSTTRNYLGMLWWLLEPVLFMGVFYVVFDLGFRRGGPGFVAFLLCGLLPWKWLDSSIRGGGSSILGHPLMNQVAMPKIIMPVTKISAQTIQFLIVLPLLITFLLLNGYRPTWEWLQLPLLFLFQAAFVYTAGCLLGSIVPFIPDLNIVIGYLMTFVLFMSGIFFDVTKMPGSTRFWFELNPVVPLLVAWRETLLQGHGPDWASLWEMALLTILAASIAAFMYRKFDKVYPRLG